MRRCDKKSVPAVSAGSGPSEPAETAGTPSPQPNPKIPTPAVLAPLIAALDDFTLTAADQDEAQGDAIGDTAKRDAAYAALREFMKELKGVAKGTLRGQPGLLAKLKL